MRRVSLARIVSCAWLALTLVAFDGPARAGDAVVTWKGQRIPIDALPANFPPEPLAALQVWGPWASEHGYRLDLDSSARAVVVSAANGTPGRWLHFVDLVWKQLDDRLPAPDRAASVAKTEPKKAAGGIPEDPEGPPASAKKSLDEALHGTSTSWGAGTRPLDTDTLVLFVIKDEEHYKELLTKLVELAPYLSGWAGSATQFPGFALEEPLAGAVVLGASGQEEWDPENEFVHRAAELSLLRRFGRQPYWVLQGWAWEVEQTVQRSIYCFPYRSGFVGIGEHGGWDKLLGQDYAKTEGPSMDELASLRRGRWDDKAARQAWGAIKFLDKFHRAKLGLILDGLRSAWDTGSRRELGAGRWERDVNFEVPSAKQLEIVRSEVGIDFLPEVRRFFQQGSSYRPPR